MAKTSHRKHNQKSKGSGKARIDIRFVILLALVLGGLGGVGGLVLLRKQRHDPGAYEDKADALLAANDPAMAIKQLEKAAYYAPNDAGILVKLAEAVWNSGPKPAADAAKATTRVLGIYSRITVLDPKNQQAQQRYMDLLYDHGVNLAQVPLLEQLIEKSSEFLSLDPENAEALKYRALAQVEIMKRKEVEEPKIHKAKYDLDAALQRAPEDGDLVRHLSLWYAIRAARAKDQRSPEVVADLQNSSEQVLLDYLEKYPDDLATRLALARGLFLNNKRDEAKATLAEVVAGVKAVADTELLTQVATFLIVADTTGAATTEGILTTEGLLAAADILNTAYEQEPDNLEVITNLALVEKRLQHGDRSIELLEKACLYDEPIDVGIRALTIKNIQLIAATELANAYLVSAEKVRDEQARGEILDKARAVVKKLGDDLRASAIIELMEGKIAMLDGNLELAASKLEVANKKFNGANPEAVFLSAIVLKRLGETGAAAERLERLASVLDGERAMRAFRELADIYFTVNDLDKAETAVSRMLEVAPEDQTALLLRSEVLLRRQKAAGRPIGSSQAASDAAIDEAMRIVEPLADAGDRKAKLQLARLYYEKKQLPQARRVLDEAWQQNPDDLAILQQLLRLDIEADDRDKALTRIDTVIERNPENRVLELLREQVKGGSNTIGMLEDVLAETGDPFQSSIGLYTLYRHTDRRDQALKALDVAARLRPADPKVLAAQFQESVADKRWDDAQKVVDKVAELNLDEGQGLFWLGRLEMAQSQFSRAATTLGRALKDRPLYSEGWRLQGDAYRFAGSLIDAEKAYEQALKVSPDNLNALFNLYLTHDARGRDQLALADLAEARKIAPGNERIFRTYLEYLGRSDKEKALMMRLQLAREKPDDATNLRAMAQLYAAVKRPNDAKMIFDKLLKDDPDNIDNIVASADFERGRDKFEDGRKLFQSYLDRRGDQAIAQEWILFARFLLAGGLTQPAIEAYQKAIALEDETFKQASRELADWYFNSQYFSLAAPLYQNAFGVSKTPRLWLRYIETLIYVGEADEARELLTAFVAANGDDAQSSLLAGIIAIGKNEYDVAEDAVRRAVELGPNTPQAYLYRARLDFLRNPPNERQGVIVDLEKALNLDPSIMAAREMLVQCYLTMAPPKIEMAVEQLQQIVKDRPTYAPARIQLAQIYASQERHPELQKLLTESIGLLPKMPVWFQLHASLAEKLKRPDVAEKDLRTAFELAKTPENLARLAVLLTTIKKPQEAVDLLDTFEVDLKRTPQLMAIRASALLELGQKDAAMAGYKEAMARAGDNPALIMAIAQEMVKTQDAEAVVRLFRDKGDASQDGTLPLMTADFLIRNDKQLAAVEILEGMRQRLGADAKNRLHVMRLLANTYQATERYHDAVSVFEDIIKRHPDDYIAMNNLAFCYTEYLQLPQKAMDHAIKAMALAPDDRGVKGNIMDTLGWAQFQAGKLDEATVTLRDSIREMPTVHNRYHLARVLIGKGNTHEAQLQLRMVQAEARKIGDGKMLAEAERLLDF